MSTHKSDIAGGLLAVMAIAGDAIVHNTLTLLSAGAALSAILYHLLASWVAVRESNARLAKRRLQDFRTWERTRDGA